MSTIVDGVDAFHEFAGQELGHTEWQTITQERVNLFAEATDDHQWIHVDPARAKEGPFGVAIAHGYLTLSLLPRLAPTLMTIAKRRRGLNYGSNKIRFISPVPAGARIRLRQRLMNAEPVDDNGIRVTSQMTMEVEGSERPAMVAETISVVYG